jgi:hypothetical protein
METIRGELGGMRMENIRGKCVLWFSINSMEVLS